MNPTNRSARSAMPWVAIAAVSLLFAGCGRSADKRGEEHADEHAHDATSHAETEEHGDERASVELTPAAIQNAGIRIGVAGPAAIPLAVEAPGEVHLNAERVLEVRPRYAGNLREIRKRVGDAVSEGEVIAVVQSNESLADYEIASPMSGTVIARRVVPGQAVDRESVLLTVADLSTVWIEFAIYPQYVGRIQRGVRASVAAQNRPDLNASGIVRYVGPLLEQDTRVSSGRIEIPNADGRWQPGMFVTVSVVVELARVAVAVPDEALVRTPEGPAVFHAQGLRFALRQVRVGRSDGRKTEIAEGIAAGDSIAVAGAFVLKSELGKGEAEHEH